MRVLVVSNLFPPVQFGGYELLARRVTEGLLERGHHVEVLTSDCLAETVDVGAEASAPYRVHRELKLTTNFPRRGEEVGFVDFRRGSIHRIALENYERTQRHLMDGDYDVVFCWCLNRMSLGPIFAAQDLGIPVCYTVNDEHPKQFAETRWQAHPARNARRIAERSMWPLATFRRVHPLPITTISRFLRDTLVEHGCPMRNAEIIFQGVDLQDFPFAPCERSGESPLRLLFAGQICENKGVHTILRAVGELRRREVAVTLDIVGHGVPNYREKLETIVAEEQVEDCVQFTGFVPHDQIARVFHDHHALIFATEVTEGFGLSHVEAMAAGCAVVSTTIGGSAELIRQGENALAFSAGDAHDLAEQVVALYRNEPLRMSLVAAARAYVERHHSMRGYIDQLEAFVTATAGLDVPPPELPAFTESRCLERLGGFIAESTLSE